MVELSRTSQNEVFAEAHGLVRQGRETTVFPRIKFPSIIVRGSDMIEMPKIYSLFPFPKLPYLYFCPTSIIDRVKRWRLIRGITVHSQIE